MGLQEIDYEYWLGNIPGVGRKSIRLLMEHFGNARAVYKATALELKEVLSVSKREGMLCSKENWDLEGAYQKLREMQIAFVPFTSPDYPERLSNIPDPPYALYYKGHLPREELFSVAVIGARRCSGYGAMVARQLGMTLAESGIQVVSGLAKGIDGIGQEGAIRVGGATFAVLGCGVDLCYPAGNRGIYEKALEKGGILSEYPIGTQPAAKHFPPRNRIISGLSDALVVVEAQEHSGTLITVNMALEQGRDVFAVPGRVGDTLSYGCNQLIRQGAGIVTDFREFVGELKALGPGFRIGRPETEAGRKEGEKTGSMLDILELDFLSLEAIYERCQWQKKTMSMQEVMNQVVEWTICGVAECRAGMYRKRSP